MKYNIQVFPKVTLEIIIQRQWRQFTLRQYRNIIKQMQKQAIRVTPIKATPKQPKSHAKSIIKQSITNLQTLYQNSSTMNEPEHLYPHVLDLTYQLIVNYSACSSSIKTVIDIGDIISNNFVLGSRKNNAAMVCGFVYLAAKYLAEGVSGIIASIHKLKETISFSRSDNSQIKLAFQNVKHVILANSNLNTKTEQLIQNAITCLSKVSENLAPSQILDPQTIFYHQSLRFLKASSHSKRPLIFKQLVASYFRYLTQHNITPSLDICRLILDALDFSEMPIDSYDWLPIQASIKKKQSRYYSDRQKNRDQQIMGFNIRKAFSFLAQKYGKPGFYVQDQCLKQTVNACLSAKPYCNQKKTVLQIVYVLYQIKKLDFIVDCQYWIDHEYMNWHQTQKKSIKKGQSTVQAGGLQFIEIVKLIISVYLFVDKLSKQFEQNCEKLSPPAALHVLLKFLDEQIQVLLYESEQILLQIWHQIINGLHIIKSQVFSRCSRKQILNNIQFIRTWSIVVQIQDLIVSSQQHRQLSNNGYQKYENSNSYLIAVREMIKQPTKTTIKLSSKLGQSKQMINSNAFSCALKKFNDINNIGLFKFWDDLLSLASYLFENVTDVDILRKVSKVVQELIKCNSMIQIAHKPGSIESTLASKLAGLCNLLITFQKQSRYQVDHEYQPEKAESKKLSYSNCKTKNKQYLKQKESHSVSALAPTKSMLNYLKKEKNRMKADVVVIIFKHFVPFVLDQLVTTIQSYTNTQTEMVNQQSYPYEDIFGYVLTLVPLIQPDLNLEQRSQVIKMRSKIVQKCSQKTIKKCRYIYHKTVAIFLQEQEENKQQNRIITYIQNYQKLYQQNSTKEQSSYRRSRRQSIDNIKHELKYRNGSMKFESNKYLTEYNKILYIDFIQWVIYYCQKKELTKIAEVATETMDLYIGVNLHDYLLALVQNIQEQYQSMPITCQAFQLLAECTNKLLYLQSRPSSQFGCFQGQGQKSVPKGQQLTRINLEFELQESSAHIKKLSKVILPFSKMCQTINAILLKSITSCTFNNASTITSKADNFFNSLNWQLIQQQRRGKNSFNNYRRLVVCLTNIIDVAYRIGYCWGQGALENIAILQIILACQNQHMIDVYLKYSEQVLLEYVPQSNERRQEIVEKIKTIQKQFGNRIDKFQKFEQICLLKLYLNQLQVNPDKNSISSSTFYQSLRNQHILKLILTLQQIQHMHPQKSLLRSISGYIFTQRSLSQDALIRYSNSLLPNTTSTMLTLDAKQKNEISTSSKASNGLKVLLQHSSNQLQHYILSQILSRLLNCLLLHNQISEFKSILKLSTVYFTRSCHTRNILLTLHCHQQRTKPQSQITSQQPSNRRSHIQSVASNNSTSAQLQWIGIHDMLAISDSFFIILDSVFGNLFEKKGFGRFSNIVLGRQGRRTSVSFGLSLSSVLQVLKDSLKQCFEVGAEMFLVLGNYACKSFQSHQLYISYSHYLSIMFLGRQQQCKSVGKVTKSQPGCLNDRRIKKRLDLILWEICKMIKPLLQSQREQFKKTKEYEVIMNLIHKSLMDIAIFSFYHAAILQSMYELWMFGENHQLMLSDQFVLQLISTMLDHNYKYKKFIEQVQPININISDTNNIPYLINTLQKSSKSYKAYLNTEPQPLISPYPLTIIYPLGQTLLTIHCNKITIITHQPRCEFEQQVNTIQNLIINNSRLLNDKNIDPKDWWKSRDRVDRSIAKIANQLPIPFWDCSVQVDDFGGRGGDVNGQKLWKFLFMCVKNCVTDVKKIKEFIQCSNVKAGGCLSIQDIIIKATSVISTSEKYCSQPENILILTHPHYTCFPYESISLLSRNRAVYRLPSISYLMQQLKRSTHFPMTNINKTMFLVNSGNDLVETQKNFYKIKENYPSWKGIVGRKPALTEFISLLEKEVFLFMGHGTGSAHLRERDFYGNHVKCFMMLFGCSSAAMTLGRCQPNGFAHSHLINGSPGVLGCLWEVTDRDTDRLTENIFKNLSQVPQNISRVLINSKKKCKHQYLNGGALVIFGIPSSVYQE